MQITVSLSAYQTWQRCEQRYYYSYVAKLSPLVRDVAPQRGIVLHEYLGAYYRALKEMRAEDAHQEGQKAILGQTQKMEVAAAAAFYIGDEEKAIEYAEMPAICVDIAERYFNVRGRKDSELFEPLLVEERLNLSLVAGINSQSVIDLVLRERERGLIWLTEHKSTKSVPNSAVRVRDFQTLLYTEVVKRVGITVDGILWNYLRTEVPQQPHQNKNGKFSKAIGIDTTWDVYSRAVRNAGQDPAEYADIEQRLRNVDTQVYFPRFEHVIVADAKMLLDDYMTEAVRMRQAQVKWLSGMEKPVRTLTRDCDYCPFYRLCEAAITGGDEEDIIRMRFTSRLKEAEVR